MPEDKANEIEAPEEGRTLDQDEIDSLLGIDLGKKAAESREGIYALLENANQSFDRLPLLEVVFDRYVRLLSTNFRNYTSDNIDIDIHSLTSIRFEDYINSIPMPSLLVVYKAIEWENYGLVTFDGSFVFSMIEVLFGGRKSSRPIRIEGRPYTTIEQGIIKHISNIMLTDLGAAFDPLSPATFQFDRLETNPRFATIARPSDPVILLQLRVDMDERGGNIEIVIPYATLEPIKELLSQVFVGEKFGKDATWETHLGSEIYKSKIELTAMFDPKKMKLSDIAHLEVGSTIILDNTPEDEITLKCRDIDVCYGQLGRLEDNVAVSVTRIIKEQIEDLL